MNFFRPKFKAYPAIAWLAGLFVMVLGLAAADVPNIPYLILIFYVWMFLFGYYKECLYLLPSFIVIGGIFAGIAYGVNVNKPDEEQIKSVISVITRLGAVYVGIIPGLGTKPIRMSRCLSQMKMPRSITLGMMIAMSFAPKLMVEVRRIREAMRTRGAGSILNPKVFYRALIIPFIIRLVNISDILALSVETRGFSTGKSKYTIYKKEHISFTDLIFLFGMVAGTVLVVLLWKH